MSLPKIIGGFLLVVAGSGTAIAQRTTTATAVQTDLAAGPEAERTAFSGGAGWHGPHIDYRDNDRHRGSRHTPGYWPVVGYGYWGPGGYVYTEESRDWFGFFGTGGEVTLIEGEAFYDYDRSYPYDWFKEPGAQVTPTANVEADYRCHTTFVESGSDGGKAPVRVCRR